VKLELKPFQAIAVGELRRKAEAAGAMVAAGDEVALVLSAPTGSGKTMMAVALLEALLNGNDEYGPNSDATFLWLSDQPDLNEQTERKFEATSSVFASPQLVTIENSNFDQETLDPGKIYFLNTQKLGKASLMIQSGDARRFTIWETLAKTVAVRGSSFWLILDEAQRGMTEAAEKSAENAQTLVQRFIKGEDEVDLPAVPLILAISATPDRFTKLIDKTDRTKMSVIIEPEEVRASGLLKETITLYHTDEEQPSDESLLAAAALRLKDFEQAWKDYAAEHKTDIVRPALVVQVEDRTKGSKDLSKTDLGAAYKVLVDELGELSAQEIGHAFQEGGVVLAGKDETPIRYVSPPDIQDDPELRVVFFKQSLSTGWDCPRAEVMMSFRTAKDETLIAQLVGRMVRTPLARTATGSDELNSVALYLPKYDRQAIELVIKRLESAHPEDGTPSVTGQRGNDLIVLKRDKAHKKVFEAAQALPNYKIERIPKLNPIRRLVRLGIRLNIDALDAMAKDRFEQALIDCLYAERKRLMRSKGYADRLNQAGLIDVRKRVIDVYGMTVIDATATATTATTIGTDPALGDGGGWATEKVSAVAINIEHAYLDAGRRLGEGLHRVYLKSRAKEETDVGKTPDVLALKREIWVLASDPTVINTLEDTADELCDDELDKHETAINHLADETRALYRAILRQGAKPKAESWDPPLTIDGDKTGKRWDKHLFVKDDGNYTNDRLTSLEKKTLAEELPRKEIVAWLRNTERKSWALSVGYEAGSVRKMMYPDFLFFRKDGEHIVCDLLEPHTQSQSDTVAKAKGLADFAESHGHRYGRIQLLDEVGGQLKRLDFKVAKTRKLVKALDNPEALRQLFADA
jgi:type III restriction enzyme